jgi:hypothetical protein
MVTVMGGLGGDAKMALMLTAAGLKGSCKPQAASCKPKATGDGLTVTGFKLVACSLRLEAAFPMACSCLLWYKTRRFAGRGFVKL